MTTTLTTALRRLRGDGAWGLALCGIVVLVAVLGQVLRPYDPQAMHALPFAPPSGSMPLGADGLGRDVLSRVLAGGFTLLALALAAAAITYLIAVPVGCLAAVRRTRVWRAGIRSLDVLLALPPMLMLLLFAAAVGPGVTAVLTAVIITQVPGVTRITYAAAAEVANRDFVLVARLNGVRWPALITKEIFPNIARSLAADVGVRLTLSILIITAANFIGLGLQPPAADWGVMMSENRSGLTQNPAAVLAPALMVVVLSIGVSLLADSVAQRLGGTRQPKDGGAR